MGSNPTGPTIIWGVNFDGEVLPLKQREPSSSLGRPTIREHIDMLNGTAAGRRP